MSDTGSVRATVLDVLAEARRRLHAADIETADLDARLLVSSALGLDSAGLILRGRDPVADADRATVTRSLERRIGGEPVHRILGRRAFYAHDFALSVDTLEPRPDTETLVELCRAPIEAVLAERGTCLLADVGTGTGIIAVSLLALYPGLRAIAVDIAPGALVTARSNADAAGVLERFMPVASDYHSAIGAPLDIIVSNPPYIPSGEIGSLSREVRMFDPLRALDGGPDGLAAYRVLGVQSVGLLREDGHLLVEVGQDQASDVTEIFGKEGLSHVAAAQDLGGTTRALWFQQRR